MSTSNDLDLDINNYELQDIYNLFQIHNHSLTTETMKQAKQIVLKMHPDKSKLDQKYFLFFSSAYKKLHAIYEFQNKSTNKKLDGTTYYKDEYNEILHNLFDKKKELKSPQNFNKWFNPLRANLNFLYGGKGQICRIPMVLALRGLMNNLKNIINKMTQMEGMENGLNQTKAYFKQTLCLHP